MTSPSLSELSGTEAFPFRRFAKDARYATVLNVMCAMLITAVNGKLSEFPGILVFSMCIGTISFALIDGFRLQVYRTRRKIKWYLDLPVVLLCAAVGQYLGTTLACLILGLPLPPMSRLVYGATNNMLIVTVMITAVISVFFGNRERVLVAEAIAADQKARAEAIERQAMQTQLQLLQAQIEPHILFNTLANVQGLIAIDAPRAQQMLDQFIVYLRATLTSSRAGSTTVGQEFALLDAYLGLMCVRMGARLAYSLDLPEALRGAALPPMLLQPLVENAILHGLEPKIDGGRIEVSAASADGMLTLTVSDTGLGLAQPPAKAGTHLGLKNTRERLHALYGERASLTLVPNHPAGAIAHLTLPVSPS